MKVYNRYILTVSSTLLLTTVILVALGTSALDAYYTLYIIEALAITELFSYFSSRTRRALGSVSIALFLGFLLVVSLQVVKFLR